MITYDISVLLGKDNPNKDVSVKRNDTGVNFRIRLKTAKRYSQWRTDEKDYMIPKNSTVVLKIAKPDKTFVLVDGKESASSALFTIPKDSTAFAVAGISKAEVSVYDENGRRITSATFNIEVTEECASDYEQDSGNYVDILADTINAVNEAADRAEAAAVNPPTISDDDTWLVWDFEKGEYVDTGVKATAPELAVGSVTTKILADKSVTREKIASGAITLDKLNEGTRKAFVPTATSQGLYAYDWLYEDAYGQPVFGNKTINYTPDTFTQWGWEIVQRDGDGFINAKDPANPYHVANKSYVDAVKRGLEKAVQEELGDIDAALEDIDAMLDELIIPNGDEVAY